MLALVPSHSPILRAKASPVVDLAATAMLAEQMIALMFARNGAGLAAPQVGASLRLFVMNEDGKAVVCINPAIVSHGRDTVLDEEGCLSFPGEPRQVARWRVISVTYTDQKGSVVSRKLTGFLARVFQHEHDHLDGICIVQ